MRRSPVLFLTLTLLTIVNTGCAGLSTALDLSPEALQQALSRPEDPNGHHLALQEAAQDERSGHVLNRPDWRQQLDTIMQRLVTVSHKPGLVPVVRIIDDPNINASVSRNGYVRVHRGLLEFTRSEDALAGVLAHELSHVDAGHIQRQTLTHALTALTSLAAGRFLKGETADQVIQTVGAAIGPAYSRKHEREADVLGAVYAVRAGFDPTALRQVFAGLVEQENRQKRQLEAELRAASARYERAELEYQALLKQPLTEEQRRAAESKLLEEQDRYLAIRQRYVRAMQGTASLFRSHPFSQERIQTILAVNEHLKGRRDRNQIPYEAAAVLDILDVLEGRAVTVAQPVNRLPGAVHKPRLRVDPRERAGKRCPIDGLRYSAHLENCPQHGVLLVPVSTDRPRPGDLL